MSALSALSSSGPTLLGRGLYSPTEASRLTRVPIRRINRWTRGYWYADRGKKVWSDPIVGSGAEWIEEAPFLDFADLMEIRCLSALRDRRIGWQTIRAASILGKELLATKYPFSSDRFRLQGRHLLAEVNDATGDRQLIDLVRDQWVFERVLLEPFRKGVQYDDQDQPTRWKPLGESRAVVVDPTRSFGAPIVIPGGVRTRVLYGSYLAEDSHAAVASWYHVPVAAVEDAVEFELTIRKAA